MSCQPLHIFYLCKVVLKYEDYFGLKRPFNISKKKIKTLSVFLCLWAVILLPYLGYGQEVKPLRGYLVLEEGDTLQGQFNLKLEDNLVQLLETESVKTYSAKQLKSVCLFDDEAGLERYYYPFPYKLISSYKMPVLFEMMFSGKYLSLLQRERVIAETVPMYDFYMGRTFYATRNRVKSELFLMWNEDKIRRFNNSRKELFSWLNDEQKAIKSYMKENKLSVNNRQDVRKIVEYYNQLKSKK